jgi:serine/threonine-protein kinase
MARSAPLHGAPTSGVASHGAAAPGAPPDSGISPSDFPTPEQLPTERPPPTRAPRSSPNNPPPKPVVAHDDSPVSSHPGDKYLGCTIDNRYKVESLLGEGGMGMVYQCRHKIIDKRVAMKILRADLARDREVTERFLIEARAASSIGNEHIIDISDFGQLPDGSAYFVMEFLEGKPLSAEVDGAQPLLADRIIRIAMQLCDGLDAAHNANIVHRDLKPDNIYLVKRGSEADFVKILDFGIAKVSTGVQGKLTQAGSVFGTPHFEFPLPAGRGFSLSHGWKKYEEVSENRVVNYGLVGSIVGVLL